MGAPMQLETVVVPKFIQLTGVSGRVSSGMVDAWLTKQKLHFDRETLRDMFDEADYRGEGSLSAGLLTAAMDGRYPKRKHTDTWRSLVALVFNMDRNVLDSCLVIGESALRSCVHQREAGPGTQKGTFNADSLWSRCGSYAAPQLSSAHKTRQRLAFRDPDAASVKSAQQRPFTTGRLRGYGSGASQHTVGPKCGSVDDCGVGGLSSRLSSNAMLSNAENMVNGTASGVTFESENSKPVRFTLSNVAAYDRHSEGATLRNAMSASLSSKAASALTRRLGATHVQSARARQKCALTPPPQLFLKSRSVPPAVTVAWEAALPPAAICMDQSALEALRNSVKPASATQPEWVGHHRGLRAHEKDKVLGEPINLVPHEGAKLYSTPPLRSGTLSKFQHDYVAWGATPCATRPDTWDHRFAGTWTHSQPAPCA